jgi:multidrug transporter EmrE-like cation transporter
MTDATAAISSPKGLALAIILFTVTTNAAAQIMLKQGMSSVGPIGMEQGGSPLQLIMRVLFQPWVILGLATFVVSMSSHLVALSRVELSFAYPFLSIAYVLVAAFSFFVFGENMSSVRVLGYALIVAGTIAIAFS